MLPFSESSLDREHSFPGSLKKKAVCRYMQMNPLNSASGKKDIFYSKNPSDCCHSLSPLSYDIRFLTLLSSSRSGLCVPTLHFSSKHSPFSSATCYCPSCLNGFLEAVYSTNDSIKRN